MQLFIHILISYRCKSQTAILEKHCWHRLLLYKEKSHWRFAALQWHHKEHDGVSDHLHLDCLLNCLFRSRSKKTSKLRVTGLCEGIHRSTVDSPHKGPVKQKMVPFADVIMDFEVICADQPHYRVESHVNHPWFNFNHSIDNYLHPL